MPSAANPQVETYRFCGPTSGAAHEAYTLLGTQDNALPISLDTGYCLIVTVRNIGDKDATSNFQLQCNVNGGGWNNVTGASSNVRVSATGDTDGATSVTERLANPAGTFNGSVLDEGDGLITTDIVGGDNGYYEFYYAIEFRSADLTGNETVTFQLTYGGATFTHNVTPTALVAATAAPTADALALTGYAPIPQPSGGDLTVDDFPAPNNYDLTGLTPGRIVNHITAPGVGGLVISEESPLPGENHIVATNLSPDGLVITGAAPTAAVGFNVSPSHNEMRVWSQTGLYFGGVTPTISVSGGGNLVVDDFPGTNGYTFTGNAPTVGIDEIVPAGNADSLVVSGLAPNAAVGYNVAPTVGSLLITEQQPTVGENHIVTTDLSPDGLVITGYAPIASDAKLPLAGSLSLTGLAPGLSWTVNPSVASLVLTEENAARRTGLQFEGYAPEIFVAGGAGGETVYPTTGSVVTFQGFEPIIGHTLFPGVGSIQFGSDAVVKLEDHVTFPTLGSLQITEGQTYSDKFIVGDVGSLVLSGIAPEQITVTQAVAAPGAGSLEITGNAPVRLVDHICQPSVDGLVLSTGAPSAFQGAAPQPGSLVLSGLAPNVSRSQTVFPSTDSLVLGQNLEPEAQFSWITYPTVGSLQFGSDNATKLEDHVVFPSAGSLAFTGNTPQTNHLVSTPSGSLTLEGLQANDQVVRPSHYEMRVWSQTGLQFYGHTPTVNVTQGKSEPTVGSLTLSGVAPDPLVNHICAPSAGSLDVTGHASSLSAVAEPAADSLVITENTPTARVNQIRSPGVDSLVLNGQSILIPTLVSVPVGSFTATGYQPNQPADPVVIEAGDPDSLVITGRVPIGPGEEQPLPVALNITTGGAPTTYIAGSGTAIVNPTASTDIPSNYEQCDYSGFRQLPGSLKMTWAKYAVRQKSWEERHPQDYVNSVGGDKQKGPKRPEQDDVFIDDLYPDGVSGDDL